MTMQPDTKVPLAETLLSFAAHIRDPEGTPLPRGVSGQRMAVYHELFFNNIHGLLSSAFPVLRNIMDDRQWHRLVRQFFARHLAETPFFNRLPGEFAAWLEQSAHPPHIAELAHYEWVELELTLAPAEIPDEKPPIDPLSARARISPLARLLEYRYPVHRIGPAFLPEEPGKEPTRLLVFRDQIDEIRFIELNPTSARLLHLIRTDKSENTRCLLKEIAEELKHPRPEHVFAGAMDILGRLQQRGAIYFTED